MHLHPTTLQTIRNQRPTGIQRLKALAAHQHLSTPEVQRLQDALNLMRARSGSRPILAVPGHTGSSLMADESLHWGWHTRSEAELIAQLIPSEDHLRVSSLSTGGSPDYGGVFVAPSRDHAVQPRPATHYLTMNSEWNGDHSWPERAQALTEVAQAAALCHPGGLVLALLHASARTAEPNHLGSVLAWTQVLGVFNLNGRHLWVLRRRPDDEARQLNRLVTGQHIITRESYARLRATPEDLSVVSELAGVRRAELSREERLERTRSSRLRQHGNVTPGYAEVRPGQLLRAYWGEWMTIRPEEHAERIGLNHLQGLATRAAYATPGNEHERQAEQLEQTLKRIFPGGLLSRHANHPAAEALGQLHELRQQQRDADPLTRMLIHANYGPVTTTHMAQAGLEQDAAEATLYAADYAYTVHGWISEHTYYDAYVMDRVRSMPVAETTYQHQAVTRQEVTLRQALDAGRQADHQWIPSDPCVPAHLVLRYLRDIVADDLPGLDGDMKCLSAHEQIDPLNPRAITRTFRTTHKRGAPLARNLNLWLSGQIPEGVLGSVLRRSETEFHAWMESQDEQELAAAQARRDDTVRPSVTWPTRPTQHLLAGWKRSRVPKPWQQAATWRFMSQRRGLNAMRTGGGKTTAQIMAMLSQVRLGHRAAIIVPTNVVSQWRQELESCTHLPFALIGSEQLDSGQWSDIGSSALIDLQLHRAVNSGCMLLLITEQAATRIRIRKETLLDILNRETLRFGTLQGYLHERIDALQRGPVKNLEYLCVARSGINMSLYHAYRSFVTEHVIEQGQLTPRGAAITPENVKDELTVIREEQRELRQASQTETDAYKENAVQAMILTFLGEGLKQLQQERHPLQTSWDELNITSLSIDELHEYKGTDNGSLNHVRYAGSLQYATRAQHMLLRARAVQARNGATLGATATPYKNSLQDIYSELDIVNPELWTRLGISTPGQFMQMHALTATRRRRRMLILNGELHTVTDSELYLQRLRQVEQLRANVLPCMDITNPEDLVDIMPTVETSYELYPTAPEAAEVIRVTGTDPVRSLANYGNRPHLAQLQAQAIAEQPHNESKIRRLYAQEALGEPRILELITQRAELDMEMIDPVSYQGYVSPKVAGLLNMLCEQVAANRGGILIYCDLTNMGSGDDPNPNGYTFHQKLQRLICERTGLSDQQVGIMNASSTPTAEERFSLVQGFNCGSIRILIGNEASMGQSHNLQGQTAYLHHLDQALNPARHEQRTGRAQRIGNPHQTIHETMHLGTRGLDAVMADRNRHKRSTYDQLWLGSETTIRNPELEAIPSVNRLRLLAIDDEPTRQHHERRLAAREDRDILADNRRLVSRYLETAQAAQDAATQLNSSPNLHHSTAASLKRRIERGAVARRRLAELGIRWEDTQQDGGRPGIYVPNLNRVLRDGDPIIISGTALHLAGLPPSEPDVTGLNTSARRRAIRAHEQQRRSQMREVSKIGYGHLHVSQSGSGRQHYGVWLGSTYLYGSHDLLEQSVVNLDGAERVSVAALARQTLPVTFWPNRDQDWNDGVGEYLSEYHDGIILVERDGQLGLVERGQCDYTALMTGRHRSLNQNHPLEGAAVLAGPQADLAQLQSRTTALLMATHALNEKEAAGAWQDIQLSQQLWNAELELTTQVSP